MRDKIIYAGQGSYERAGREHGRWTRSGNTASKEQPERGGMIPGEQREMHTARTLGYLVRSLQWKEPAADAVDVSRSCSWWSVWCRRRGAGSSLADVPRLRSLLPGAHSPVFSRRGPLQANCTAHVPRPAGLSAELSDPASLTAPAQMPVID